MEFGWNDEFEQFRQEVRTWARDFRTPELALELREMEDGQPPAHLAKKIRDTVDERGWMRMCWPPELGGQGKSPWYQFILVEELSRADVPYSLGAAGMIGPAIALFGTPEQKQRYLPPLWSGAMSCTLGYSEPNAGTDLASLETTARREGDEYVINGQKIWTSGAHRATHVWLAARTDPAAPKHRSISMFIVPLDSPGISVRPIYTMSGVRTNETFYEDVRVPTSALIGEENRGWYTAANALDHERVSIGAGVEWMLAFERLVAFAKGDGRLRDRAASRRLAEASLDLHAQRALALLNADIVAHGDTPTMEASMSKVWSTELVYRLTSSAIDLMGRAGVLASESEEAPLGGEFELGFRASPIRRFGGGTNEVQRNIIAQRGLGLPR